MRFLNKRVTTIFLSLVPLFYSCATILNEPVQKLVISTDENIKIVSVNNSKSPDPSLVNQSDSKTYTVLRSNEPLVITLQIDSTQHSILLNSRNSAPYLMNILYNFGIGILVDKDDVRRYTYPARNYFTATDTIIKRYRFPPTERGTMLLSLSLPLMLNHFTIKTTNGHFNSGGVYGLKTGFSYFYKRNNYLSLNGGAATNKFGEYWLVDTGYFEHCNVLFASLKNNHSIGSFDVGYGIHLSRMGWTRDFGDTAKKDLVLRNVGIGPAISAEYRFGKCFRIGCFYQPVLYDLNSMEFTTYQHYFSLDFLWQLPIRTPVKRR